MISILVFIKLHLPRTVYSISYIMELIPIDDVRFVCRVVKRINHKKFSIDLPKAKNVLVIEAGDDGALIIK